MCCEGLLFTYKTVYKNNGLSNIMVAFFVC
nr:MAG TPA: hypothetical protein [Caudoviricetes sp.]